MSTTTMSPYAVYLSYLQQGKLAYQFSPDAGRPVFFPRLICPYTGSTRLEWRVSKGLGTVYSTSTVYPRQGQPYNVSLVDCDEGFRVMTRMDGLPSRDVVIGMRVQFTTHVPPNAEDEDCYPVFTPCDGHQE